MSILTLDLCAVAKYVSNKLSCHYYCQYESGFTEGVAAGHSTTSRLKQVQVSSADIAVLHYVDLPTVGNIPCGFREINNLLLFLSLYCPILHEKAF